MTGMSYVEKDHPRGGNPYSRGEWTVKNNSAPDADLLERINGDVGDVDVTPERFAKALELIEDHANMYAYRYQLDPQSREDIVQDTVLDMLAQHKKGKVHALSELRLVNTATRAVASRYIDPTVHHSTLTARHLLKKTVELEEEALGRKVTDEELEFLADDLRMKVFNPRRRPAEDYWKSQRSFSMDFEIGEGTTFADTLAAPDSRNSFAEDESELADAVEALESKAATKTAMKQNAWNLVAAESDTPKAVAGTASSNDSRKAVEAVRDYPGGVAALAKAWQAGTTSDKEDRALFAGFSGAGFEDQERIVDRLLAREEYADGLWRSSVSIASAPAAG